MNTLAEATINGVDLVNKVDAFYNAAWQKLVIAMVLVVTLFGTVVPLIIHLMHAAWFNSREAKLRGDLAGIAKNNEDTMKGHIKKAREDTAKEMKMLSLIARAEVSRAKAEPEGDAARRLSYSMEAAILFLDAGCPGQVPSLVAPIVKGCGDESVNLCYFMEPRVREFWPQLVSRLEASTFADFRLDDVDCLRKHMTHLQSSFEEQEAANRAAREKALNENPKK